MTIPDAATMLAALPYLADEALRTWGTKPVTGDTAHAHSIPGSACLADTARLDTLSSANTRDGLGVLADWVHAIRRELDEAGELEPADLATMGNNPTVATVCVWLDAMLPFIHGRGFEPAFVADLAALTRRLRAVCRYTPAHAWPCLTTGCSGNMRERAGMLECDHGHRHDGIRKWQHHASMPLPDAAAALNVPYSTLARWAGRGTVPTDPDKGDNPRHVWPWDVLRQRYPDLVELAEYDTPTPNVVN